MNAAQLENLMNLLREISGKLDRIAVALSPPPQSTGWSSSYPVYGYTCSACGTYMVNGGSHVCMRASA